MTRNPPKLLRVAGMLLICLTLFALAGGHWAVLQTIAWAQMLRDYSKNVTIAEAIVRTFSGGSPCGMCTKITTERQKEEKAPAIVKLEKKAEICPFTVRGILSEPAGRDYSYPDTGEIAPLGRAEAPPVPIPIFS